MINRRAVPDPESQELQCPECGEALDWERDGVTIFREAWCVPSREPDAAPGELVCVIGPETDRHGDEDPSDHLICPRGHYCLPPDGVRVVEQ